MALKGCAQACPLQSRICGSIINERVAARGMKGWRVARSGAFQNAATAKALHEGGAHVTALQRPPGQLNSPASLQGWVTGGRGGLVGGLEQPRFPTHPPPQPRLLRLARSGLESRLPLRGNRSSALQGSLRAPGRRAPAGSSFVPARLRQQLSLPAGGAAARCPVHQHHLGAIGVAQVAPGKGEERSAGSRGSPRASGKSLPQRGLSSPTWGRGDNQAHPFGSAQRCDAIALP